MKDRASALSVESRPAERGVLAARWGLRGKFRCLYWGEQDFLLCASFDAFSSSILRSLGCGVFELRLERRDPPHFSSTTLRYGVYTSLLHATSTLLPSTTPSLPP